MITMKTLRERLQNLGYTTRPAELLALTAMEAAPRDKVQAALLEGPPGCGKTALASTYADTIGATLVYAMCHAWTDDQELFRGVDVAAAVAGDAARVEQPGVLAKVARLSQDGMVVLCIDELDKAPERVENLLLDVLQSGRVPVRPGEHLALNIANVVMFITSNGQRAHTDAFLRRVRRVRMSPLDVDTMNRLVVERTGVAPGMVTCLSKAARAVAAADKATLSLQELVALVTDAWNVAGSADDLRELVAQWGARGDAGVALARRCDVAPAWGEIKAHRQRASK